MYAFILEVQAVEPIGDLLGLAAVPSSATLMAATTPCVRG